MSKRHKLKVVIVSGHSLPSTVTYVTCSLIDLSIDEVWRRYQAKTPLGEGKDPMWKKSLVFGGMPDILDFALRFDVFSADNKKLIGRVELVKEEGLKCISSYEECGGTPNTKWSNWHALKNPDGKCVPGFLHIAIVPPTVKTADANLSPPCPAPTVKKEAPKVEVKKEKSSSKSKGEKPWTAERTAKAKKKRVPARQEIIDSEQTYMANLNALMSTYVEPMTTVVSSEDHKKMFTDVKSIHAFHMLFVPKLKETKDIGAAFVKYADYLKIYTEYINHYAEVINTLSELRKQKKFTNFIRGARKSAKMEITSYLIQPVQRIPRYVLLLKELKKYTWPEHEEYENLVKALSKAKEIALHVNERKRQIEHMSKTLEVQQKITGEFDSLIKPGRKMIREDKLIKVTTGLFNSIKRKERIMFLFSDLLMWTTTSYQYRDRMSLAAARLEKSEKMENCLEVSSSRVLCVLVFDSKSQMEQWIKDFEEGKKYAKQVRDRLRKVKRRTLDSKRGKAHTLVMNAFKTLEKKSAEDKTLNAK
mmetsp:Transcript_8901/g.13292  ORF Transcript_8901/g.13292 Transcript_8901/m.13292 type:complete len:532 (-) Transcript_8901:181-1776(-)|eukprot:CAMPEP_0167756652 /NCGR_PEP_ID=MMETSP0110_2-20121227/9502_1 /TAXON_ID=629695 /ORGANISM="Gymnochlora sp., Strain CCMP2014" /LENGTH=531 /DNA_ID=CAMNT_0007642781 /DNA_START=32 /DNA_END=1627 /DNA_ORIENTATION=-